MLSGCIEVAVISINNGFLIAFHVIIVQTLVVLLLFKYMRM